MLQTHFLFVSLAQAERNVDMQHPTMGYMMYSIWDRFLGLFLFPEYFTFEDGRFGVVWKQLRYLEPD
ncbi:hypothetical protein AYI68_g4109 [Smittium mucronatum]|uniref:Uncharacterized protein n=1 Tax=Smittium mucronatum TaxID=133383 RepID=A0A1R0GY09_9FUNG|nr:hypothetical protein AYI68_g4109 [Smittium mucronatum]